MSAASYREPYKVSAGMLTLAVHGGFFALLYLGFTWQTLPPAMMSVELWDSLPEEAAALPVSPVVEEIIRPPQQPEKLIAPDIALPDKKKDKPKPVEKMAEKRKPEPKHIKAKTVETGRQMPDTTIADQQAAQELAEKAAEIDRVVGEYKLKIQAKIKRNIVMPPNVPDNASAVFSVTLLPGGSVLAVRLVKASGNAQYDQAVERAILKSEPLPLPPDVALFNKFRELKLTFQPTGQ